MRIHQLTLGAIVLLSILCSSSSVMANPPQSIPISSSGQVVYAQDSLITKFYSGKSYGAFIDGAPTTSYYYCTTQWFASLDTSGNLIPRHGTDGANPDIGWGDAGIDNLHLVQYLTDMASRGLYHIIRIWLNNLDMNDSAWFGNSTVRSSSCPAN